MSSLTKFRCYYLTSMGEEVPALSHHDDDGDWVDAEEAEQRIAELEQLFVDCVDPMELYPEGEKLWNEIHKRLYPENYGVGDE